jgi:Asp-tRNA(Asn)/Glu-tRNA(Gln) amidotransferase C subunit
MKNFLTILAAIVALTTFAQVTVLDTETVQITTKRVRTSTIFRNDPLTGELTGADVETVIVKSAGTNVISIAAGPSVHLTVAQVTNTLTNFNSLQVTFDGALTLILAATNSP